MKKNKLTAILAAIAVLTAAGCGGTNTAQNTSAAPQTSAAPETSAAPAQTTEPAEEKQAQNSAGEDTEQDGGDESGSEAESVSGFKLKVSGSTGKMSVSRAAKKSTSMGDADTWTIFLYLCGTDLESSGQGSASSDINQILEATASENVRFVVQTGGTSEWMNALFGADESERYLIQNGEISKVDSVPLASMGKPDTLADFLSWGVSEYPAEKMGVIFWDHGGGSISGACFDELNENDSLSLSEINTAFSKVYADMTDKFEFIGFDCCLMGTVETANVLASYARYFYGSQETEPGSGWDYTTFGSFLADDPSADGAQLGKVITDSFYDECAQEQQENECTFSIIDLEKFDDFVVAFNDYSNELYTAAQNDLSGVVRSVNNAENFGGNNKSEGYTNMVDVGGIISQCAPYADGSAVLEALNSCLVYNKNGSDHTNASGLSVYYPLHVEGSSELKTFSEICISPYYLSLADMVAKGYTDEGYSNSVFFTEDGDWTCEDCSSDDYDESYFEYADDDDYNSASQLITFDFEPTMTDQGNYGFKLDENGLDYTESVEAYICADLGDDVKLEIGETFDVIADWDSGLFVDNFDGYWLALPNGQLLATYIVSQDADTIIYTSPILLNGKRTNLRIRQTSDGITIDGAWDGIAEDGSASREIRKISAGDTIVPVYIVFDYESEAEYTDAPAYTWQEGDTIVYSYLPAADYYYCFGINDIYGDTYISETVTFSVDEEGNISF